MSGDGTGRGGAAEDPRRSHAMPVVVPDDAIDDLGHANNAAYLAWVEACCRAHAERLGFDTERFRAAGALPVARRHVVTYRRPAYAGERLVVSTAIVAASGPRATRRNEVRRADDGALLAEVETEWAWIDPERGRPRPIPPAIAEAFGWPGAARRPRRG